MDCGSARCRKERIFFRRELMTWSKKVPYMIGLEQVAGLLLGSKLKKKISQPFESLENLEETQDWEPPSSCTFCTARSKQVTQESDSEDGDNTTFETTACEEPQPPPFPALPFTHLPTTPFPIPIFATNIEDGKPLDLSAATPTRERSPSSIDGENVSPSGGKSIQLKVPQILKSGKKRDGKRAYTEEELASAISDVRSGKIGTRRASSLYGIPRSTLRNKIFKMESGAPELKQENKLSMGDLLQMPSDDFMSALSLNIFEDKFAEWERKLEQIRRKHNLLEPDRKFGMPSSILDSPQRSMGLFDGEGRYGSEHKLPFLPELVRKMAERRLEEELRSKHVPPASTAGYYDESYISPLQLELSSPPQQTSTSASGHSPVELKIPSYKPMKSTFKNGLTTMVSPDSDDGMLPSPLSSDMGSNRVGDTLKDIIAKTIAEKVRSRTQVNGNNYYQNGQASPLATHNNSNYNIPLSADPSQFAAKRRRIEPKSQSKPTTTKVQQDPVGPEGQALKKTRPKRGQYRKYNSQLLIEAVKAVQRGEMSVHRAGSYFGVPHSTLEYKVKERHLLRQKKGRETKPTSTSSSSSTSNSSTTSSSEKRSDSPPYDKPSTTATSTSSSVSAPAAIESPSPSTCSSSVETASLQRDIKDEPPEAEETSTPGTSSPEPTSVEEQGKEDVISASALLAAHANEMLMAAHVNNPAMMQLAHQAALSSLALGSPFPLLAAWGQPNGFLPLGMPDPAMMAAAAAAGYPFAAGAFPVGVNTSASDLLKKLQQKVENKVGIPDMLEPGEIPRTLNSSAASSSSDSTQVAAQ